MSEATFNTAINYMRNYFVGSKNQLDFDNYHVSKPEIEKASHDIPGSDAVFMHVLQENPQLYKEASEVIKETRFWLFSSNNKELSIDDLDAIATGKTNDQKPISESEEVLRQKFISDYKACYEAYQVKYQLTNNEVKAVKDPKKLLDAKFILSDKPNRKDVVEALSVNHNKQIASRLDKLLLIEQAAAYKVALVQKDEKQSTKGDNKESLPYIFEFPAEATKDSVNLNGKVNSDKISRLLGRDWFSRAQDLSSAESINHPQKPSQISAVEAIEAALYLILDEGTEIVVKKDGTTVDRNNLKESASKLMSDGRIILANNKDNERTLKMVNILDGTYKDNLISIYYMAMALRMVKAPIKERDAKLEGLFDLPPKINTELGKAFSMLIEKGFINQFTPGISTFIDQLSGAFYRTSLSSQRSYDQYSLNSMYQDLTAGYKGKSGGNWFHDKCAKSLLDLTGLAKDHLYK